MAQSSNKAQRELQGLLDMQAQGAQQAANTQKLLEARNETPVAASGEASFALPEALATAVGAGWLLGPVGGVLLGVAQGILGQREEQRAIDAYAEEMGAIEATQGVIYDELERMALDANPEDLDTISGIQSQVDAAMQMASSPLLRERSVALMEDAYTKINALQVKNEEQRIEADVLQAQRERDMDKDTLASHERLLGDFRTDSANFRTQLATADNVIEALNRGDGASLTAALASMPLLVNPDAGATTDAEVKIWEGVGGVVDSLLGKVEKELGAGGLTDDTRKQIIGVADQYKRNAISAQQAVESFYGKSAVTRGIPEKYWREYNISSSVPDLQGGRFMTRSGDAARKVSDAVQPYTKQGIETNTRYLMDNIQNAATEINKYVGGRPIR